MYHCPPVVCPLAPSQIEDDDQRHNGDDSAGTCPDARIFDGLCKGIEPCESRFCWHFRLVVVDSAQWKQVRAAELEAPELLNAESKTACASNFDGKGMAAEQKLKDGKGNWC